MCRVTHPSKSGLVGAPGTVKIKNSGDNMKSRVTYFLLASVLLLLTGIASAGTMTFEGLATNQFYSTPYTQSGVTLTASYFWIAGPGGSTCGTGGCVDDGTNVAVLLSPASITAASVFTLNSLDYAWTFVDAG